MQAYDYINLSINCSDFGSFWDDLEECVGAESGSL